MKDYIEFSVNDFVDDRYFQSWVLSPDETTEAFWQAWLDENHDKIYLVDEARRILESFKFSRYNLAGEDVSLLWNQIQQNLKGDATDHTERKRMASPKFTRRYTAAAVLLVGISVSLFRFTRDTIIEHQTAFGETKTILLPDSSSITLNSNSKIRFSSNWDTESIREVKLDGEAFFTVVHKQNNQPFHVITDKDLAIEVLGTTFNVNYRNSSTKVVLNSGKIRLSLPELKDDSKIIMKPGEFVEYKEKKYIKQKVDPKLYTAWTENKLIFNHTSLREIISMLKDTYGVDVAVKDELLEQTISGSMPISDVQDLIRQIAKAYRLKIITEEDKIYMTE